jgi:histone H3
LCAEILETSSIFAREGKRVRITVRDLELSIRNDKELNELFTKLNIELIGGGVVPFIHPTLLSKKRKQKDGNVTSTQAIKEIKMYQKESDTLTIAKHPFEKIIREHVHSIKPNMKISKDVFVIIQHYIEQYIVDIIRHANFVAIHAGRVKIHPSDLQLVLSIRENNKNPARLFYNNDIPDSNLVINYIDIGLIDEDSDSFIFEEIEDLPPISSPIPA